VAYIKHPVTKKLLWIPKEALAAHEAHLKSAKEGAKKLAEAKRKKS
jgi:hypothetical protein